MTEALAAVASVVALLECAVKISGYLASIKERHEDRDSIRQELSSITGVLFILKNQATSSQDDSDTLQTLKLLDAPHGLLEQLTRVMAILKKKLGPEKGVKVITWPLRKDEAKDILNALGRQQNLLNLALQGDHIQLSRGIKSDIAELNTQVADVGEKLSEISIGQRAQEATRQAEHIARRRQAILEWLSPLNFQTRQDDLFAKSQIGSGQWFLDCSEFKSWLLHPGAVIHGKGIPGAGKTFLASRIVQHLRDNLPRDNAATACIYCDFQDSQAPTIESMLASIHEQFVRSLDPIPYGLVDLYDQHARNRTRPTTVELTDVIHKIVNQGLRAYVVIDALDEYHDVSKIVDMLNQLQQAGIHLLITSRHSISLESHLRDVIHVEVRAHADDLVQYVKERLPGLQCIQRRPDIKTLVIDEIVKASDGMFLLARLHFDSLHDRASPKAIKNAVKEMPKGLQTLPQVYDGVMVRIQNQTEYSRDQALIVLTWLFFARAALSPRELQHALAIEPDTDVFDEDNVSDVDSLVSVCKGLVSVDQESNAVRLSHYTVQEYFQRSTRPFLEHGERMIATACLTYLSYKNLFDLGYKPDLSPNYVDPVVHAMRGLRDSLALERMPLLRYASKHWGAHAIDVQKDIQHLALELLSRTYIINATLPYVIACRPRFVNFNSPHFRFNEDEMRTRLAIQNTHLCAHLDLDTLLAKILKDGADPNAKDILGGTPLHWAAESLSLRTIRLLLGIPSIDVNAGPEGEYRDSPVAVAAHYDHTELMGLLVGRADTAVNTKSRHGHTPLFWAARNGNTDIVRILLSRHDIQPNMQDDMGQTALTVAATSGHTSTVDLLLGRADVDVNIQDDMGQTALTVAATKGHTSTVNLLLERADVDVNLPSGGERTPLVSAVAWNRSSVIHLLLDKANVEVNTPDEFGRTPIVYAAKNSLKAIVDLLLEREDLDASCGTEAVDLLITAAKNDWRPLLQHLLQRENVAVNMVDATSKTALMYAIIDNNTTVVEMLLAHHGIDTTVRTSLGFTALDYAHARGVQHIIELVTSAKVCIPSDQTAWSSEGLHVDKLPKSVDVTVVEVPPDDRDRIKLMYDRATLLDAAAAIRDAATGELLMLHEDLGLKVGNDLRRHVGWFGKGIRLQLSGIDIRLALEKFQGRDTMGCAVRNRHDANPNSICSHYEEDSNIRGWLRGGIVKASLSMRCTSASREIDLSTVEKRHANAEGEMEWSINMRILRLDDVHIDYKRRIANKGHAT